MKGPDTTTQQQTTEPPAYLQPHLSNSAMGAHSLFMQGPRYVPFSPQTNQAMNMQQNRALTGSPVLDAAKSYTQNTLSGNSPLNQFTNDFTAFTGGDTGASPLSQFTNQQNPYLDATFDRAAGAVNRNLDTVLARSGRDLHGNFGARSDAINNLATNIYGGAYENDRGRALSAASQLSGQIFSGGQGDLARQQQASESARDRSLQAASTLGTQQLAASGNAIPLSREDYFDISQLGNVGSAVEAQAGNIMEAPYTALDRYISQISGMPGQTTTATQPLYDNTGSTLGSLAGMYFGPMGMVAGGLLGGLFD